MAKVYEHVDVKIVFHQSRFPPVFVHLCVFFHRMIHPLSRYVGLTARHHQNQLREV